VSDPAECILQADTDHRTLVTIRCSITHPGEHSYQNPACQWSTETLRYQSAAIGEGHCPWGHGRLADAVEGKGAGPTYPPHGWALGYCGGCRGVWGTGHDASMLGQIVSWWPDLLPNHL
jgi:hypothetical protein